MIKKIILLITLTVTITTYSQHSKISIGLQAIPLISPIRGNSLTNTYDSRINISPGVTFDYYLSEQTVLNTGLSFERKRAKTEITFLDETGHPITNQDIIINYDYLTLPIILTYSTSG